MSYRNPKLLALAKDAPRCFCCHTNNYGNVVACHSNQSRDGKGMSMKAHDYRIAYLCNDCHRGLDSGNGSRADNVEMFEMAHRASIGWLFESGKIGVMK